MKYLYTLLLIAVLIPRLAFAQLTPNETVKGNRRILTQEEVNTSPKQQSSVSFNKNKVIYVFGAIGLLVLAGFGAVQLIGPSKKPTLKE